MLTRNEVTDTAKKIQPTRSFDLEGDMSNGECRPSLDGDQTPNGQFATKSGDLDCPEVGELRWSKKSSVAAYTNLDENKISWEKEEALILTLISVARTLILNSLREAQCSVEEDILLCDYDP